MVRSPLRRPETVRVNDRTYGRSPAFNDTNGVRVSTLLAAKCACGWDLSAFGGGRVPRVWATS